MPHINSTKKELSLSHLTDEKTKAMGGFTLNSTENEESRNLSSRIQ